MTSPSERFGIDLSKLPSQWDNCKVGRVLIHDTDLACYEAASTVRKLSTAIRRVQQKVLEDMFLTRAQSARLHLTSSTSTKAERFMVQAVKPYQANRSGKAKPSLLEPLREAMALPENWLPEFESVTLHRKWEADDGMIIDAHLLKGDGVISSGDKDLRCTPYPYYERNKAQVMPGQVSGHVRLEYTEAGNPKLVGQGPMFFWAQMLMGDTADNVAGLTRLNGKLCGPVAAYEFLERYSDAPHNPERESEAANAVLLAYKENDQNPLPEGWLLHLLRSRTDNFWAYLSELDLCASAKEFLCECNRKQWFKGDNAST